MAHHFATRIVATVLVVVVDTLDAQRRNARGDFGWDRFLQIHEVLAPAELCGECVGRDLQGRRQRAKAFGCGLDFLRPRPDRLHRCADRQRITQSIENPSAVRGHFQVAAVARRSLLLQKVLVEALQVKRAPREKHEEEEQAAENQRRAKRR